MTRFRDLRASLQGPRKTADAWYGKRVMRPLSIYVTWLFGRLGLGPSQVTFLSLVFALFGIAGFARGNFGLGILGMNLWYLLDHVDGEIARLRNEMSLSGTFFDSVVNFLIQPFTFLAWSFGLAEAVGGETLGWGAFAAAGSVILLAIPITEESVLFNESVKRRVVYQKGAGQGSRGKQKQSLLRRGYRLLHTLVTFPVVLFVVTVAYLALRIPADVPLDYPVFLYHFLRIYTFGVTGVWVSQVFYKVYFRTLDRYWKPL